MDLKLAGKTAIVTGGTRGIGYACADLFAQEGCRVLIVGSREESVSAAVRRLEASNPGATIEGAWVDLGGTRDDFALVPRLQTADIVVNNAGAIPGGSLSTIDDRGWREAWELKVYGYLDLTRQALPAMTKRGNGVIVNVIGIAGVEPRYDYLCGSMANAALVAFTNAGGAYASRNGVRIVGVNPGPTQTERLVKLYESRALERFGDASRWKEMLADLPFGRPAQPEEVADLIVYLASPRASYLSGTVIDVDGGARFS